MCAPLALEKATLASTQMSSTSHLPVGTRVTAVIKDDCTQPGPITSQIENRFEGQTAAGVRSYDWTLPRAMTTGELASLAKQDHCVESLSESRYFELPQSEAAPEVLPDDPKVSQEAHLAAIGASEAYDIFLNSKTGIKREVIIAVIDTGVRLDHEDLRQRLWINRREIPSNGIDDDLNGYIDDVYGYNFASRISNPNPQKTSANGAWQWAHGTRVAGLAAATSNNSRGIAGIAPNARIMALNTMGTSAGFSQSDLANAIRYATDNGAKVINLSLGGNSGQTTDYKNAIRYAISRGVTILAAAGNESMSIGSTYSAAGLAPYYAGLISIGNFQAATFAKAPSSNYNTQYVKLGAPGTRDSSNLLITTSPESSTSYSGFSGTSAATPVASGAAALAIGLIETRGYSTSPAVIEKLLLDSARKLSSLRSYFKDGNALNIANLARLIETRYPAQSGNEQKDEIGQTQLPSTPQPELPELVCP